MEHLLFTFSESLCYVLLFSCANKNFLCWRLSNDCQIVRPALVSGPPNRKTPYNKHLISLVFSVLTVNYGSSLFSVRNLQYGPKTRLIRGIYYILFRQEQLTHSKYAFVPGDDRNLRKYIIDFILKTSNSWHYSCPRSVFCRSIAFLLVV